MTMDDMKLVRLLAEKIGIETLGQLEEFKKRTKVTTNETLIQRLALFVATGMTFEEAKEYERVYNKTQAAKS